jgi:hypothetical protein
VNGGQQYYIVASSRSSLTRLQLQTARANGLRMISNSRPRYVGIGQKANRWWRGQKTIPGRQRNLHAEMAIRKWIHSKGYILERVVPNARYCTQCNGNLTQGGFRIRANFTRNFVGARAGRSQHWRHPTTDALTTNW